MTLRDQAIYTANALENLADLIEQWRFYRPSATEEIRKHAADLLAAAREEQGNG